MEHRGHHVHAAGRLPALLAPQADADVENDHEWQLPVWLTGMGRLLGHREGLGEKPGVLTPGLRRGASPVSVSELSRGAGEGGAVGEMEAPAAGETPA